MGKCQDPSTEKTDAEVLSTHHDTVGMQRNEDLGYLYCLRLMLGRGAIFQVRKGKPRHLIEFH